MSLLPRNLALRMTMTAAEPELDWEETACLLCGSASWSLLLEAADAAPGGTGLRFAVAQCQQCGLRFTNPRPTRHSLQHFYPAAYPPHQPVSELRRGGGRTWSAFLPSWLATKHPLRKLHGQGRLLDFGCGSGAFLQRMQHLGWQVTGVDTFLPAIERLRNELGLRVFAGSLPHPHLPPQSFDVVTMFHSLEHVPWPRKVLTAAHDLLVANGKLLVAVPNIHSLPYRLFGPAWCGLDLPRHLTHFSIETLRRILGETGFYVETVRMVRHSSWLRTSARRAWQSGQRSLSARWLQAKLPSRLVTWYSWLTRQADCLLVTARKVGE